MEAEKGSEFNVIMFFFVVFCCVLLSSAVKLHNFAMYQTQITPCFVEL